MKVKTRSQKAKIILKSQIDHATYVSWPTFAKELIRLLCPLGVVKQFSTIYSQGQVKVSRMAKEGQSSNFMNVNKKGAYQMQFELRNPIVSFILLCDDWNMPKCAFGLLTLSHDVV